MALKLIGPVIEVNSCNQGGNFTNECVLVCEKQFCVSVIMERYFPPILYRTFVKISISVIQKLQFLFFLLSVRWRKFLYYYCTNSSVCKISLVFED